MPLLSHDFSAGCGPLLRLCYDSFIADYPDPEIAEKPCASLIYNRQPPLDVFIIRKIDSSPDNRISCPIID